MSHSEFHIAGADELAISDGELSDLLDQVYVAGGYTDPDEAIALFAPASVRGRGEIIGARETQSNRLAGMVIFVPPGSSGIRLAEQDTAELHLLGVMPNYRGRGLGRELVDAAINRAVHYNCRKIILWTQVAMGEAQRLYQSLGFVPAGEMERGTRKFKVYELALGR